MDKTVRLWCSNTGESLYRFSQSGGLRCVIGNETLLVTAGINGVVNLFDLARLTERVELQSLQSESQSHNPDESYIGHRKVVNGICFDRHAELLASCSDDKSIILWER